METAELYADYRLKEDVRGADTGPNSIESFRSTLESHGLTLQRGRTTTLQVNVGLLCNQACRHCHLEAGPCRKEMLDSETMQEVAAYAQRGGFDVVDITGGAPEMNPTLIGFITSISPHVPRIMLRSNLTALADHWHEDLIETITAHRVALVASFPSVSETQTKAQRGSGVFEKTVSVLKTLNELGYGQDGSGLQLNLVSNPTGAFLPPCQADAEKRFRRVLHDRWGVAFNSLFSFANVPLGRFRRWLEQSGNLKQYMQGLASNFNQNTLDGLMCRTLVSVSWDGYLYDCDFNLARGLFLGGHKVHVSEMNGPPEPGSAIACADHCYTCTAGSGFT